MVEAVEEGEGKGKSGGGESSELVISRKQSGATDWLSNFHRDLMAGALMGGVVHTIVAPIERAKLLLQTQESNTAILTGGPHRRFKGMVDCIVRTVREEGFLSLWRGNGSSVIRYYPSVALNFSLKVIMTNIQSVVYLFIFLICWIYGGLCVHRMVEFSRYYDLYRKKTCAL